MTSYREPLPDPVGNLDSTLKSLVDERKARGHGWPRDPTEYHESSRIAACPRALWYEQHGTPREETGPDFGSNRGAVGKAVEYQILRWFAKSRILVDEQVYVRSRHYHISGIIDGILDRGNGEEPMEIKSVDDDKGGPWSPRRVPKGDAYLQLQCYLLMTGVPAGVLVYYDIGKISDWWAWRIEANQQAFAWIEERSQYLDLVLPQDFPPDRPGNITAPDQYWRCGFCPFKKVCFP